MKDDDAILVAQVVDGFIVTSLCIFLSSDVAAMLMDLVEVGFTVSLLCLQVLVAMLVEVGFIVTLLSLRLIMGHSELLIM